MSIASRIQEMETHIGNAYTSIDNLGIDISNTNKNIYNISTLLDTFYERIPKVSGIGSSLSLSPSMVGKIKLNEIQGNTLQDGTPTPSSPVPIQSVTGLQNVEICGKNLLNYDNNTNLVKFYIDASGNKVMGGVDAYINEKIGVTPSGTYYLSFSTRTGGYVRICEYQSNGTFIRRQLIDTNTSFTVSNNCTYIFANIDKTDSQYFTNLMIKKSPTASEYEPYKGNTYEVNLGNIELNKIGTYEDYIFKNEPNNPNYDSNLTLNSWYITKNIGKVVLDGSESDSTYNTGTTGSFTRFGYLPFMSTDVCKIQSDYVSNYFKYLGAIGGDTTEAGISNTSVSGLNRLFIFLPTSTASTIAQFKTWLTTHNTEIKYIMATPKYTVITNTELIEQLETLNNAKSEDGTTNINVTSEDLSMLLNVGVIKGDA